VDNYPGNSRRVTKVNAEPSEKPEEKKIESVVQGEVIRRKKPLGRRFLDTFVGGDAKSVMGYVVMDVLLPAAKDTIADAFSQGIERMLFGEARSTSRRTGARPGTGYTSYNRFASSSSMRREDPRTISRQNRARHDFDEIILATRVEAEEVIGRLFDLVSQYEQATVADLYELVGITANYTEQKWGWTDIRGAGAVRVSGGYLLDLPRPVELD
jgi:hypothetical protein